jgi:hypothetical protein
MRKKGMPKSMRKNIHANKHEKRKKKIANIFKTNVKRERVTYKGVQKLEIFKIPHTCTS